MNQDFRQHGEASGFTTVWVDITRPSPNLDQAQTAHRWWLCAQQKSSHVCKINRGHSCSKQQRAHYSGRRSPRGELSPAHAAQPARPRLTDLFRRRGPRHTGGKCNVQPRCAGSC